MQTAHFARSAGFFWRILRFSSSKSGRPLLSSTKVTQGTRNELYAGPVRNFYNLAQCPNKRQNTDFFRPAPYVNRTDGYRILAPNNCQLSVGSVVVTDVILSIQSE